jgi:hypothetical protein
MAAINSFAAVRLGSPRTSGIKYQSAITLERECHHLTANAVYVEMPLLFSSR